MFFGSNYFRFFQFEYLLFENKNQKIWTTNYMFFWVQLILYSLCFKKNKLFWLGKDFEKIKKTFEFCGSKLK